jgi:hypothetical protein
MGQDDSVVYVSGWNAWPVRPERPKKTAPPVAPSEKLLAFFRSEFMTEEHSGFARLKRVPDTRVESSLGWYQSLSTADKASFVDYVAHRAHLTYGFVVGAPEIDVTRHPFHLRWSDANIRFPFRSNNDVRFLSTGVGQYKVDQRRGEPSCVSEDLFHFASSVKPIRAKELRKRILATLATFGFQKTDEYGGHRCVWEGQEFEVNVDLGGNYSQFRYGVTPSEFRNEAVAGRQFRFEGALGMGLGDWTYIVKENVDDVFRLFEELIQYAASLPRRMKKAVLPG